MSRSPYYCKKILAKCELTCAAATVGRIHTHTQDL